VFFGCDIHEAIDESARIEGLDTGFLDAFYLLPHTKSGVHHPDGVLWIKNREHRVHTEKVSILDIVPTLLEHFGIDRHRVDPTGQMQGRSLLPLLTGATATEPAHPDRVALRAAVQRGRDA